jgi:hypothetical protein
MEFSTTGVAPDYKGFMSRSLPVQPFRRNIGRVLKQIQNGGAGG